MSTEIPRRQKKISSCDEELGEMFAQIVVEAETEIFIQKLNIGLI